MKSIRLSLNNHELIYLLNLTESVNKEHKNDNMDIQKQIEKLINKIRIALIKIENQ